MFRDTEAFKQLVSIYTAANADDPIGLYLGAGVNLPTSQDEKNSTSTRIHGMNYCAQFITEM